jgi:hypothetical protein
VTVNSVAITDAHGAIGWSSIGVATPPPNIQAAVKAMPRVHALALCGALCGFDERELAALVGVPPQSVRPLVRLAAAKLGSLLAEPGNGRVSHRSIPTAE